MAQTAQAAAGASKVTSSGVDLGARVEVSNVQLVGYGFVGSGIGFYAPLRDGVALVDGQPAKRTSKGGFVQVTYKLGDLKLGASYGASLLDRASGEPGAETLVHSNSSVIAGAYYSLGGVVTLTGELTYTLAKNQAGDKVSDTSVAVGASMGF
jgi:predicted porin